MDEQNTNQVATAAPTPEPVSTSMAKYASFWERLIAMFIDGILVGVVVSLLGSLFGFSSSEESASFNPFFVLGWVYYVFMIYKYGQTLGKKAMKIKVQKETGESLTVIDAILREIVGKFLSSFFLIGYFWMLKDSKKQTWHDKIAKTIVVKVN